VSIINERIARYLRLLWRLLEKGDSHDRPMLFAASDTPMEVVGTAELPMCFSGLYMVRMVRAIFTTSRMS